jgi:hypothetical protein
MGRRNGCADPGRLRIAFGQHKVDGAAVSFPLPGPGEQHFDGKLSEDGKSIAGNLTAGGQPIPLALKWKSEPRAVEKAPSNTGDVQVLEGVWEGVLDAHGQHLHVRFDFNKNADGGLPLHSTAWTKAPTDCPSPALRDRETL